MSETEFTMMRPEEALAQAQSKLQSILDAIAEKMETYDGSDLYLNLGGSSGLAYPNEWGQLSIAAICAQFGWVVEFHDSQRDGASVTIRPNERPANIIEAQPGKKFVIET